MIGLVEDLDPLGHLPRVPEALFGFYVPVDLSALPHLFRPVVRLQIALGALFVARPWPPGPPAWACLKLSSRLLLLPILLQASPGTIGGGF